MSIAMGVAFFGAGYWLGDVLRCRYMKAQQMKAAVEFAKIRPATREGRQFMEMFTDYFAGVNKPASYYDGIQ